MRSNRSSSVLHGGVLAAGCDRRLWRRPGRANRPGQAAPPSQAAIDAAKAKPGLSPMRVPSLGRLPRRRCGKPVKAVRLRVRTAEFVFSCRFILVFTGSDRHA